MKGIRNISKKTYSAMTNGINKEALNIDIAAIFEKQLSPYVTKNHLKEVMLANGLKATKEMAANMCKYHEMMITTERNMFWKFLSTAGGCAVLLMGIGGYTVDKLDQKIDKTKEEIKYDIQKLDQKIDKTKEEIKYDIQKLDQKIDNLEKKLDRIIERCFK